MTNYRRRKPRPIIAPTKNFAVNNRIKALTIRVIAEDGTMIGVMSKQEALIMAEDADKDLVEINPKAEPPIVKLIEYTKFRYQQEKSEKKVKVDVLKMLRVSVRISIHDLQVQSRKADEFIEKDYKVKLEVRMERREKAHPEVAMETMQKFLAQIKQEYIFETPTKLMNDNCTCTIKSAK